MILKLIQRGNADADEDKEKRKQYEQEHQLDEMLAELRRDDSPERSARKIGAKPPVETHWNCIKKEGMYIHRCRARRNLILLFTFRSSVNRFHHIAERVGRCHKRKAFVYKKRCQTRLG